MMRSSQGFTLAELLVAVALMSIVASAVAVLVTNTHQLASAQSRIMDAQQRARVIADTLGRDLRLAGAGLDRGPMFGPVNRAFSPIWPRRVGRLRADTVETARPDVITLVHVPDTATQTTLAESDSAASGRVVLAPCLGDAMPCPVVRGTTLALFDPPGRMDLLGVLAPPAGSTQVRSLGASAGAFEAGALVAEVVVRSYYFDAAQGQLRLYDGDASDQPVVDAVASLTLEYFGTADPPQWPRPAPGDAGCAYDAFGSWRGGVTLVADDHGLARLPLTLFRDGPWCGAGGTAFDVDLLRVRRIRVVVILRGTDVNDAGPAYRVAFDITPRNLSLNGGTEEEMAPW